MSAGQRIDAFTHFIPPGYRERMEAVIPAFFQRTNILARPALYDLGSRLSQVEQFDSYVQILTNGTPALEEVAPGPRGMELAQLANDCMAETVKAHPDHFAGFVATVMLEDVEGSIREVERAVNDLGALGAMIHTNCAGHPMDEPRFEPFFAAMEQLDRTIWVHPARGADFADYRSESSSRYGLNLKFGWPYETATFMARMIFSGVMDRHPRLKILTHHAGGFVPHLAGRLTLQHETSEQRQEIGVDDRFDDETVLAGYRRFYGDLVFSGAYHPLRCALDFFGADHLLFATDTPWGGEAGLMFIRETIAAVEAASPDPSVRGQLFEGNARRILNVD